MVRVALHVGLDQVQLRTDQLGAFSEYVEHLTEGIVE